MNTARQSMLEGAASTLRCPTGVHSLSEHRLTLLKQLQLFFMNHWFHLEEVQKERRSFSTRSRDFQQFKKKGRGGWNRGLFHVKVVQRCRGGAFALCSGDLRSFFTSLSLRLNNMRVCELRSSDLCSRFYVHTAVSLWDSPPQPCPKAARNTFSQTLDHICFCRTNRSLCFLCSQCGLQGSFRPWGGLSNHKCVEKSTTFNAVNTVQRSENLTERSVHGLWNPVTSDPIRKL